MEKGLARWIMGYWEAKGASAMSAIAKGLG